MRVGASFAHRHIRQVIRLRSTDYTVTRISTSAGRFGEQDQSTTTVNNVSLWVYDPVETNVQTQFGERLGGDIQAAALDSTNIEYDDRIDHGAETYEVEDIVNKPDENDKQFKLISFQRVTN